MKVVLTQVMIVSSLLLTAGCSVTADKAVYSSNDHDMMISGRKQSAWVSIYINGALVIEDQSIFDDTLTGEYQGKKVVATCMHKSNWISTEDKCDVYVDGKYAVELDLSRG